MNSSISPGKVGLANHLLVRQLRFTRGELIRCLDGVDDHEARKRFKPMNSISWIIGHLADQENLFWVRMAQGIMLAPGLRKLVGYGRPASTPPLEEMWETWRLITTQADQFLDSISEEMLMSHLELKGKPAQENTGTMLLRNIHHYWFHIGEAYAIRQQLKHKNLPDFVGEMSKAGYF